MPLDTKHIWTEVHRRLRAFIAGRVPHESEVDDILQEVFLRMHRNLNTLNNPDRVVSWVFQITRHVISDYYRSPNRQREIAAGSALDLDSAYPLKTLSPPSDSPDSPNIRKELAACLLPMMKQLPPRYEEALMLVELNGLTQKAAAHQLGLSVSGMKSRVQRGRRELKQLIDDCCVLEMDRRGTIIDYSIRDTDCQSCESSSK